MSDVPNNKHYQRDIKYILMFIPNVMRALGVWPSSARERSIQKIFKYLIVTVTYIIIVSGFMPCAFFWIVEKRTHVRIKAMPIILYGFMNIGKYANLIFREAQIRRCLKYVEEDWRNVVVTERNTMLNFARIGRRLVVISAIFMYSCGISVRVVIPLSKGKTVNEHNVTIRPLPLPAYLFSVNTQASPTYELIYTTQFLSGLISLSIGLSVIGLLIFFVMHGCGQLEILVRLIRSLVEEQWYEDREVEKKLACVVEHQTRTRNFLQLVDQTLQQVLFIEIAGAIIIMCIAGYCIMMEWESSQGVAMYSYLIILITSVLNLFFFCYTCEHLNEQSEKVATVSCELEWYRLPNRKARTIVLVMIISNMPIKITAGKIINLSIRSYGEIMRTTAAYFNVLRSVV